MRGLVNQFAEFQAQVTHTHIASHAHTSREAECTWTLFSLSLLSLNVQARELLGFLTSKVRITPHYTNRPPKCGHAWAGVLLLSLSLSFRARVCVRIGHGPR